MAGGAVLYHLYHQRIGIAVGGNGHHPLHIAAGLALAPDLLTAAAPEHGAPLGNGQRQRFGVHVGKGEHLLCVVILHDGGDQAFFIKFQFHDGSPSPDGDTVYFIVFKIKMQVICTVFIEINFPNKGFSRSGEAVTTGD